MELSPKEKLNKKIRRESTLFKHKRIISLFLTLVILSISIAPVFAVNDEADNPNGYSDGYLQGQQDAVEDNNGYGWMLAGGCGTILFGLIGGGIIIAASAATKPTIPPPRLKGLDSHSNEYCEGYREGYLAKANNIKTSSTLGGVGLGLIGLLSLIRSAQ